MELKDATNFLLIREYIQKRNHSLHYFEHLILQNCLKYYSEPQIFFFLPCGRNLDSSSLQKQYEEFLKDYSSCSVQVAQCNNEGDIWICKNEIIGWSETKKYEQGKEKIEWLPYYGEVWNSFPGELVKKHNCKILLVDDRVTLVVFYKKAQFNQVEVNEGRIIQYAYQLSYQKSCDIIYGKFDEISYSFLDNKETMNRLGIEQYFRWLRYFEEQEEELKRKLIVR